MTDLETAYRRGFTAALGKVFTPSAADLENLKAIRRAVNRTAYHGGLGLRESGQYLATLDRLLASLGVGPDDGPERDPDQSLARRPEFPDLAR